MKLETVSKIKGWVALACLSVWVGIPVCYGFGPMPAEMVWYSGFAGLVCIPTGISWFRGRKRLRELEYAGRAMAKGR